MKKEEIQAIWKQFKSNEQRNAHRENDILLAKNFGSKQQREIASYTHQMQQKQGYVTPEQNLYCYVKVHSKLYPVLHRLAEIQQIV
jgi:hypothetical protein